LKRSRAPALRAAATEIDGARAGIQTARAYPNPEVEYMAGSMNYRPYASGISGASDSYSITQPLDLPFRRTPRIAAARAGLEASKAGYAGVETDWIADLRLAWFGALRRMAEKANAQIDLDLMQSVYAKIQLRVQQGDAPRIELIRAEADLLNVQKAAQAAALREDQARLQLRALVGPDLPEDFTLTGQLEAPLPLPALGVLQDQALAANPRWPAPAPRWSRPATGWIMRNRGVCPSSAARHA
jgi:cobalt-zinc-cadmium efflux system outer membrane protein